MLLEIRIIQVVGGQFCKEAQKRALGVLVIFFFLIWVLATWMTQFVKIH